MKLRNLFATAMVALSMLMASCGADDIDFAKPDNTINPDEGVLTPDEGGEGFLALSELGVMVDVESEDFDNDDSMNTKAGSEDVEAGDGYLVYIYEDKIVDNEPVSTLLDDMPMTYADAKAGGDLKLTVGNYSLRVRSCETIESVKWGDDAAEYASNKYTFQIKNGKTTTTLQEIEGTKTEVEINAVKCTLANVKCTVSMSADLKALFNPKEDLTVTLAFGDPKDDGSYAQQAVFKCVDNKFVKKDGTESVVYFDATPDAEKNMKIILNGYYNTASAGLQADYKEITWSQTAEGVKSGQHRMVTINLDNLSDGKTHIDFTIKDWVPSGSIGISVSNILASFVSKGEDSIIDPDDFVCEPNSPVVTLTDLVIENNYVVYPGIFDEDNESYSPKYSLVITPEGESTVASISVSDSMDGASYELFKEGAATEAYKDFYTTTIDSETNVITMEALYAAMKKLDLQRGEHIMKLEVVDSEGRTSKTRLGFTSTELDPPTILWNNDFSKVYPIYPDKNDTRNPSIFLTINSTKGLSSMSVEIISDVLTPAELATMNLAQKMDLVFPATPEMKKGLVELGFPTGNDVLGKTYLELDITDFMPLLAGLPAKGVTKFVISAGDEIGTCTRTLTVESK